MLEQCSDPAKGDAINQKSIRSIRPGSKICDWWMPEFIEKMEKYFKIRNNHLCKIIFGKLLFKFE